MKDNWVQDQYLTHYLSFYQVALHGGFRAAGDASGISKSVISARVKSLEDHLRTRLFQRSTRSVRLTPAGKSLFVECEKLALQLKKIKVTSLNDGPLQGTLKISAPIDLCAVLMSAWLSEFRDLHPGLSVELLATDEVLGFEKDGINIALRVDAKSDAHLYQQKLGEGAFGLFCSSLSPIAKMSKLEAAEHLNRVGVIGVMRRPIQFKVGKTKVTLTQSKSFQVDSMLCAKAALQYAGKDDIACLPKFILKNEIARGEVMELFSDVLIPSSTFYMISDRRFDEDRRVKILVAFLKEKWNLSLEEKVMKIL